MNEESIRSKASDQSDRKVKPQGCRANYSFPSNCSHPVGRLAWSEDSFKGRKSIRGKKRSDHVLKCPNENTPISGDMDVAAVESTHILASLNYLRTDYVPRRITNNNEKKLSPKTVYHLSRPRYLEQVLVKSSWRKTG